MTIVQFYYIGFMTIFICDDEEFYVSQIQGILQDYFKQKKIDSVEYELFNSGEKLLESKSVPDIAFPDVEIANGISGTNVGKILKDKNPRVKIFIVTSHTGYIEETLRYEFYRFIQKPINELNLKRNINDALNQNNTEIIDITIETKSGEIKTINLVDIIAVKVEKRGTVIYFKNSTILCNRTISEFEKILSDSRFFRTHRDFIINMRYVVGIDKIVVNLRYGDSTEIEAYISHAKRKLFKEKYLWYKERML